MESLATVAGDSAVTWVTAAAGEAALMVVIPVAKMVSGDRTAAAKWVAKQEVEVVPRVMVVHGAMGAKGAMG